MPPSRRSCSDHDGLAGDWGVNNFYLYRPADSERFRFIPWDKDVNFRETGREIEAGFEGNALLATAMGYSRFRDVFRAAARRCAVIAEGWLEQEIARQAAIDPDGGSRRRQQGVP